MSIVLLCQIYLYDFKGNAEKTRSPIMLGEPVDGVPVFQLELL